MEEEKAGINTFYKAVWKRENQVPEIQVRIAESREAFIEMLNAAGYRTTDAEIHFATVTDIIKHYRP